MSVGRARGTLFWRSAVRPGDGVPGEGDISITSESSQLDTRQPGVRRDCLLYLGSLHEDQGWTERGESCKYLLMQTILEVESSLKGRFMKVPSCRISAHADYPRCRLMTHIF